MSTPPVTRSPMQATWVGARLAGLRFDIRELSGSLGDLGTFLPLAVAMALTCRMDLGLIFIFAGVMHVLTGVVFGQPIPVQPMKAIAAVAIAEGLTAGAIASAGLWVGAAVLLLALFGGVDWLARAIPRPVVRGIQAGVGLKLAWLGVRWLAALPAVGIDSWITAVVVGLMVAATVTRRLPVLLFVFIAGFVLLGIEDPAPFQHFTLRWPAFHLVQPSAAQWWEGLSRGAIVQLPLTLLNSVVAVCALSADYFPGRAVRPKPIAVSVGLMNLLCVPFGGMPMCHGAGGLAAQYRFGARTGGSVVMLGVLKIGAGLFFSSLLITTLQQYPRSILAVMIIVAGLTLAQAARDAMQGRALVIVATMVVMIITVNTLAGFVTGCAVAAVLAGLARLRTGQPDDDPTP